MNSITQCTCPTKFNREGTGLERAATDRLCPAHGEPRGMVKTREQLIVEGLRSDIVVNPSRKLTPREQAFVREAEASGMCVIYNREGKPFALGAPNNRDSFSEVYTAVVSQRWLFDKEGACIYSLRRR